MTTTKRRCIVVGNGPSKKLLLNTVRGISAYTIGCNRIYSNAAAWKWMSLDMLLAADVWCQFDVVRDEYPGKNRCKFVRWNPIPIEVYSEEFVQSMCPGYKVIEHNPEQRKYADSWMFYATSKEDFETAKALSDIGNLIVGIFAGYQPDTK